MILLPLLTAAPLLGLAPAMTGVAGSSAPPDYALACELTHAASATLFEEARLPALQVAVSVDGVIVWTEALGRADLETKAPATTATRFRIASLSKALTGTVAAALAHEGVLDIDAPVRRYVPTFPDKGAPITARQLAGHLGGIRHYRDPEIHSLRHYDSLTESLAIFADDELLCAPGAAMNYSTYGYTLLGVAMEGATRQSFTQLMQKRLFEPLGMRSTVEDVPDMIIPDRARPYQMRRRRIVNAPPTDHSYKVPGGGYLSTAEDLVRFGAEVAEPHALAAEAVALALTAQRTSDGETTGYGMGWNLRRAPGGHTLVSHGGSQPGSRAYLLVDPEHDIAVAFLTNLSGAPLGLGDVERVRRHFLDAKRDVERRANDDIDVEGVYELTPRDAPDLVARLEIWRTPDGLTGVAAIDGNRLLFRRIVAHGNRVVAFAFDDEVVQLDFRVNGRNIEGTVFGADSAEIVGRWIHAID